jgi:hypothetical protein
MLILFALGVMSLLWMAVVAALIFAEKVLPVGGRLSKAFAVSFVAFGIVIAAAPGSVPGLTQPDSPAADDARMRMDTGMQMEEPRERGQVNQMGTEMQPGEGGMAP